MSATVIIPARYASTRLPGKPLLDRTGKPLIQHVVEAVKGARLVNNIVVATDDERIRRAVEAFGGHVVMTSLNCRTGTDRLAEAAGTLGLADDEIIINVQGDEPEIPPACIDKLIELLTRSGAPMATLATPLPAEEAGDSNKVKVVFDHTVPSRQAARLGAVNKALYFSRAKIPFDRDGGGKVKYFLHIGIYAYRAAFLKKFAAMPSTAAEQAEKLEQLRALEHGHAIAVETVDYNGSGIDTPEDYEAFVRRATAAR